MESSYSPSATSTVGKSLIDELTQGQASTNMLRVMLHNNNMTRNDLGSDSMILFAENLLKKMLDSFDNSLLILNCSESEFNEASTNIPTNDSSHSNDGGIAEDMRRCKRRRRLLEKETTKVTPLAEFEDGHAWRKYGQKPIHGTEHPRSYFRCSYKNDQGCQATKTVQQIQDDPPLFKTTYHGDHTCKDLFGESEVIIQDNSTPKDSSIMLSFNKHEFNYKSTDMVIPMLPTTPEETKESVQDSTQHKSLPSDHNYFGSHHLLPSDQEHLICSDTEIETMVVSDMFDDYLLTFGVLAASLFYE